MVALAVPSAHPQAAAIRDAIVDVLSRIYLPRCDLNGWEWCERNIILDPEESRDNHGPYSTAETLYVRRVFEFITRPDERELIIMKSAQLGFTLAYMLIVCYVAATAPTHVLYAMHSGKKAKEISTRLQRLLTKNISLADTLLGEPEETLHNLLLKLRGMVVVLTGSGSAGEFDAASFGLVILDELDRHVAGAKTKGQANTIDLARDRIKEVVTGKLLAGGTPEEGTSETVTNHATGTREQLHMPCPACHTYQPFDFQRLEFTHCKNERGEWDYDRVRREVYMRCVNPACTHRIVNADKRHMLVPDLVRWVRTNHGQDENKPYPGRVSVHINDLYSTRDHNTWGDIACLWIGAQKDPSKLRRFWNRVLGCPPPDRTVSLTTAAVRALAGGYDHGCIPLAPYIAPSGLPAIILYADQQDSCLKWVKMGFSPGHEWVIDYGTCLHRDDLLEIAARPVAVGMHYPEPPEIIAAQAAALEARRPLVDILRERHPGTWFHDIVTGGIDEGNGQGGETFKTRAWCLQKTGMLFFPTKGSDARSVHDLVILRTNRFFVDEVPVTVVHFCDADLKTSLYIDRIAGVEAIRAGRSEVPELHLPANPTKEFCEELSAERRDYVMHKGKRVPMWLDPTDTNDWGDAVKGCLVMWQTIKHVFDPTATPPPTDDGQAPEQATAPAGATMEADGRITRPAA